MGPIYFGKLVLRPMKGLLALGRDKTGKVVENIFGPAHVKEHVRIIKQYRRIGSRLRGFAWVKSF